VGDGVDELPVLNDGRAAPVVMLFTISVLDVIIAPQF